CYLVKSSKDHYEVSIKDNVQQNHNIKPAHFECTCFDFKFRGLACKHIFTVYQKFYLTQTTSNISDQTIEEPEVARDVTFDSWVEAIQKVWNRHNQEVRNRMTDADLEAIVEAGMKRKSNVDLYEDFTIPESNLKGTHYNVKKQPSLSENTRFGKKGSEKKIKAKIVDYLKQSFLNSNLYSKDKLTATEMHEKLLKLAHSEEINEDHVLKVITIQNWIEQYSREFNQKEAVIALETFKAVGSSSIGKD
ncbi:38271_t:CDS:2, partial [Gigaspora margarita]